MNILPKLFLLAGGISFIVSIVLAFADRVFIAGPNGWLDLALACAVFSIAIKYVHSSKNRSG